MIYVCLYLLGVFITYTILRVFWFPLDIEIVQDKKYSCCYDLSGYEWHFLTVTHYKENHSELFANNLKETLDAGQQVSFKYSLFFPFVIIGYILHWIFILFKTMLFTPAEFIKKFRESENDKNNEKQILLEEFRKAYQTSNNAEMEKIEIKLSQID